MSSSSAPARVVVAHSTAASISRAVRFDDQCVLIPQCAASSRSRRPKVVTKSYSLPLWKRRSSSSSVTPMSDSDCTDDGGTPISTTVSSSPEETHVVLRLPIPSFVRSTSSGSRSPSTSPTIPLSPCLVQRSPSTPVSPLSPTRRPSLPIYHRRPDDQTVPLRPCCPDCVPITEESLKEGSTLKENFTRGARRRRSASLDSTSTANASIIMSSSSPTLVSSFSSTSKVSGSSSLILTPSSTSGESVDELLPTFTLTVDEVDKRRRKSRERLHSSRSRFELPERHSFAAASASSCSSSSLSINPVANSPQLINVPRKASPIAEEDESELFPLPSPRRSPSSSPHSASPDKTSPRVSPKLSPVPSPGGSSSCLHPSSAAVVFPAAASLKKGEERYSVDEFGSELEEKLGSSVGILRKDKVGGSESGASTPRFGKPTLTLFSSSSVTTPTTGEGGGGDTAPNSPTTPSMTKASSTTTRSSFTSLSPSSSPRLVKSPRTTTTTTRSFSLTSPVLFNSKQTPSSSSPNNNNTRKGSFTLPFLKAGGAVLKGVSSISGGMGGGAGV